VLVAFDATHYVEDAVLTAAKLAARRRRGIHVLVTIPVPNSSPIDAAMPEQEQAAQAVIEQAKLVGGRRVSGHWEKVRLGQTGRLIVEEAREMRAKAIVMPLPARRGGALFGPTLETVLAERPCRVIIESTPAEPKPRPPAGVP
jgi:APA family basic amino acid/polyamine antiporter